MEQLVKLYRESHLGKRLPAYDGRKSLYTAGPLPFLSKEFRITLLDDDDGQGGQRFVFCQIFLLTLNFPCFHLHIIAVIFFLMQEGERIQSCDKVGCSCWPTSFRTLFAGEASWCPSGSPAGSRHCSARITYNSVVIFFSPSCSSMYDHVHFFFNFFLKWY